MIAPKEGYGPVGGLTTENPLAAGLVPAYETAHGGDAVRRTPPAAADAGPGVRGSPGLTVRPARRPRVSGGLVGRRRRGGRPVRGSEAPGRGSTAGRSPDGEAGRRRPADSCGGSGGGRVSVGPGKSGTHRAPCAPARGEWWSRGKAATRGPAQLGARGARPGVGGRVFAGRGTVGQGVRRAGRRRQRTRVCGSRGVRDSPFVPRVARGECWSRGEAVVRASARLGGDRRTPASRGGCRVRGAGHGGVPVPAVSWAATCRRPRCRAVPSRQAGRAVPGAAKKTGPPLNTTGSSMRTQCRAAAQQGAPTPWR